MSTSQATQQQPGASKMILVLDDEAEVRKLVAAVLTRNGYKVVTADNGDNAIKAHKMKPVISPNRRHTKTPIAIAQKFRWFDRALYRLRYTVERTFGWQDIYRTLDVRFVNPMPVGAGLVPAQPRATTRVAPTASMERRPHASRGSLLEVGLQPEARPDDWRCIYETDI